MDRLSKKDVAATLLSVLLVAGMAFAFATPSEGAEPEIGTREFSVPTGESYSSTILVIKFVDPDNGYVCYITPRESWRAGIGISCVNPRR